MRLSFLKVNIWNSRNLKKEPVDSSLNLNQNTCHHQTIMNYDTQLDVILLLVSCCKYIINLFLRS